MYTKCDLVWLFHEALTDGLPTADDISCRAKQLQMIFELLSSTHQMKCVFHLTGYTISKLAVDHPSIITGLKKMLSQDKIEIVCGAFFAPVLSAIPESDAIAQIQWSMQMIKDRLGYSSKGIWLTGYIWDGILPITLSKAGIRYAIVKSSQISVGIGNSVKSYSSWVTEKLGYMTNIFAITDELHKTNAENFDFDSFFNRKQGNEKNIFIVSTQFEQITDLNGNIFLQKWLNNLLEYSARFSWKTIQERLDQIPAEGKCTIASMPESYLPMLLSSTQKNIYNRVDSKLHSYGMKMASVVPYWINWDAFLSRFPESNRLHKKMLFVSSRFQRLQKMIQEQPIKNITINELTKLLIQAQRAIGAAQIHSAYWTYPLGSFEKSHVRQYAWEQLLIAQKTMDIIFNQELNSMTVEQMDVDRDGIKEILVTSKHVDCVISLRGGVIFEYSFKEKECTLNTVLTRQEFEFKNILKTGIKKIKKEEKIEDSIVDKSLNSRLYIEPRLRADRYVRDLFLDHFIGSSTTPDNFYRCQYQETGDFLDNIYEIIRSDFDPKEGLSHVHIYRNGFVRRDDNGLLHPIRLEKRMTFYAQTGNSNIEYIISNRSTEPIQFRFGTEFSLGSDFIPYTIEFSKKPETRKLFPKNTDTSSNLGMFLNSDTFYAINENKSVFVKFSITTPATWWWFFLETFMEKQFDNKHYNVQKLFQGTVFFPNWNISLWGNESISLGLSVSIENVNKNLDLYANKEDKLDKSNNKNEKKQYDWPAPPVFDDSYSESNIEDDDLDIEELDATIIDFHSEDDDKTVHVVIENDVHVVIEDDE